MDGLPADVDGGESGGGEDGFGDFETGDELAEEGGLSGAGASGDEDELTVVSALGGDEFVESLEVVNGGENGVREYT